MTGAETKLQQLSESRFDLYRFDDFDPAGQPRYFRLESDLSLEQIIGQFSTQPASEVLTKLAEDAWRGGAFLTPELLVIVSGDTPRV